MECPWCRRVAQSWRMSVHVQPGAKRTEVVGLHGDALKIRIASPPVDGRANEALIAFIASRLSLPRAAVVLVQGAKGGRILGVLQAPAAER